jgi:hypothetical protein
MKSIFILAIVLIGVNAQSDSINPSNCGERPLQPFQLDDPSKIVGGTVAKVFHFYKYFSKIFFWISI